MRRQKTPSKAKSLIRFIDIFELWLNRQIRPNAKANRRIVNLPFVFWCTMEIDLDLVM